MGILGRLFGLQSVLPASITDENFESEVLRSDLPVVVDIWSAGCAPCRQLEEVMMSLAHEFQGRVKVCEMNVSRAPRTAYQLGIRSTPTVLYIHGGEVIETVVGYRSSVYHREAVAELFGISAAA